VNERAAAEPTVGHLTRVVQVRMFQLYYERLRHLDVTPGEFGVLATVSAEPGIQHGALAQALAIRGPNLTKLVDKLVREGRMERRAVKNDKRTAGHYLTDKAQAKVQRILKEGATHDERVTSSALSASERKILLKLLTKLADGLPEIAPANARPFKKRTGSRRTS
jgi:DNA-binding MarR family transcriptional regulator